MVVQDGERNAFDQRWLEYELLEQCVSGYWPHHGMVPDLD